MPLLTSQQGNWENPVDRIENIKNVDKVLVEMGYGDGDINDYAEIER